MNNSSHKSNLINLFNNLSETSNNFLTEINQNFNKQQKLYGGDSHNCPCIESLKAFNTGNVDLGLYILKEKNCCFYCKDENGNTLLHHLIQCCTKYNNNNKYISALMNALKLPDVADFINIQNSNGTTAILLAVENENEVVANKLDEAGADKSIADNTGNYLQTDDISEYKSVNYSETPNEQVCINNVVNLVVNDDKKDSSDLSSLNLSSLVNNSNNTINSNDNSDIIAEKVKNKIIETFGINDNSNTNDISSLNLTSSDNYLDSDKFIKFLSDKYNKEPVNTVNKNMNMNTFDLTSSDILTQDMNLLNETTSQYDDSDESLNSELLINALTEKLSKNLEHKSDAIQKVNNDESIDTDVLMKAIDNIQSSKQFNNVNLLEGGANTEKIMGYRKLILHSDKSDNFIRESQLSKLSKYSKKSNKSNDLSINLDLYYSDGESGVSNNELSRLINSRKNDLHNEVINMIMGMLNKGLIIKNSKPIEASEKNAKLIKSFLYRIVSEKNPQLTGMYKILMIKKMNDKEIIESLTKMPDLDDLEENIRKHIEDKQQTRQDTQSNSSVSTSEEKSKKKTSKKSKQSRSKKVSKKNSKVTSKKNSKKVLKK